MTQASRLMIVDDGGLTEIEFVDRNILDEANIQQIGEEIGRVLEKKGHPRLLINFQNVDHLSSAALGMLITLNTKVADKGGHLALTNISGQIREVFTITKLDRLFEIHPSIVEAKAALRKGAKKKLFGRR